MRTSRWIPTTSNPRLPKALVSASRESPLNHDPAARILGVDPGSARTGWAILSGPPSKPALVDCGTIQVPSGTEFAARLHALHCAFSEIVVRFHPTTAAVERPFHGINAHSAFQLAQARGVIMAVLGGANVPVAEYAPAVVKKAVTGNGRADKSQVQRMIVALLRLNVLPDSEDASDAVGIAYCHASGQGMQSRLAAARGRRSGTGRLGS